MNDSSHRGRKPSAPSLNSEKQSANPASAISQNQSPPPGRQAATRNRRPAKFNVVTGLSERDPYNILQLKWGLMPLTWVGLGMFLLRIHRQLFYANFNHISEKHRLDEGHAGALGNNAYPHVNARFGKKGSRTQRMIAALRSGQDTSYILIRGLATVGWFATFPKETNGQKQFRRKQPYWIPPIPPEMNFPERHREAEYWLFGLWGHHEASSSYSESDRLRRQDKQKALDERLKYADYVMAGLAHMLDCQIKPRFEGHALARNLITDPGEQQASDLDNVDMALRFQQSAVEKRLPEPGTTEVHSGESCQYRIYLCVKNFWRLPIYLLPVWEIIEEHFCPEDPEIKKRLLAKLQDRMAFERSGPRSANDAGQQKVSGPILVNASRNSEERDWIMSFDYERVKAKDPGGEQAIQELREAIRRARRDAVRIKMRPGEVLLVDNLRAMTSRREFYPIDFNDLWRVSVSLWLRRSMSVPASTHAVLKERGRTITGLHAWWPFPPHRWLRTYYAFRNRSEN